MRLSSDELMMDSGVAAFQLVIIDLGNNRERTTCCEALLTLPFLPTDISVSADSSPLALIAPKKSS